MFCACCVTGATRAAKTTVEDDSPRPGGAKSVLSDLLGTGEKKTQAPKQKDFVLDSKYTKSQSELSTL